MTLGEMRRQMIRRVVPEELIPQNIIDYLMDNDAEPPALNAFTFLTRLRDLGIGSSDFIYLLEGCGAPQAAVDKIKANPAMSLQALIVTLESAGMKSDDYSRILYTARQIWERTLTLRLEKTELISEGRFPDEAASDEEFKKYDEPEFTDVFDKVTGEMSGPANVFGAEPTRISDENATDYSISFPAPESGIFKEPEPFEMRKTSQKPLEKFPEELIEQELPHTPEPPATQYGESGEFTANFNKIASSVPEYSSDVPQIPETPVVSDTPKPSHSIFEDSIPSTFDSYTPPYESPIPSSADSYSPSYESPIPSSADSYSPSYESPITSSADGYSPSYESPEPSSVDSYLPFDSDEYQPYSASTFSDFDNSENSESPETESYPSFSDYPDFDSNVPGNTHPFQKIKEPEHFSDTRTFPQSKITLDKPDVKEPEKEEYSSRAKPSEYFSNTENPNFSSEINKSEKYSRTEEPKHSYKVEEPDYYSEAEKSEHSYKTEKPDFYSRTEEPKHSYKTQEPDYSKAKEPEISSKTEEPVYYSETEEPEFSLQAEEPEYSSETKEPESSVSDDDVDSPEPFKENISSNPPRSNAILDETNTIIQLDPKIIEEKLSELTHENVNLKIGENEEDITERTYARHSGALAASGIGAAMLLGFGFVTNIYLVKPPEKEIGYAEDAYEIFASIYTAYSEKTPGGDAAETAALNYDEIFGDLLISSDGFGTYTDGTDYYSVTSEAVKVSTFNAESFTPLGEWSPPENTQFVGAFDDNGAPVVVFGGEDECGFMKINKGEVVFTAHQDGKLTDFRRDNGELTLCSIYTPSFYRTFSAADEEVYLPKLGTGEPHTVSPQDVVVSGTLGYSYGVIAHYSIEDGAVISSKAAIGDPVTASADGHFAMNGESGLLIDISKENVVTSKTGGIRAVAFFEGGSAAYENGIIVLRDNEFNIKSEISAFPDTPDSLTFSGTTLLLKKEGEVIYAADCSDISHTPKVLEPRHVKGLIQGNDAVAIETNNSGLVITRYALENGIAQPQGSYTKALSPSEKETLEPASTNAIIFADEYSGWAYKYFNGTSIISDYAVFGGKNNTASLFDNKTGFIYAFEKDNKIYAVSPDSAEIIEN